MKKTIFIHETAAQSLVNDVITFGLLTAMFWINQTYLGHAIPDWVLATIFLMAAASKTMLATKMHAKDKEHALKIVEDFYAAPSAKGETK